MEKDEYIERYGEEAYIKLLKQKNEWRKRNPEKAKRNHIERDRKGGKHYEKALEYEKTGLRGKRNGIRRKHSKQWYKYKRIVAPESQIHHEWISETAKYRGMALVERDRHMHGFIDVIEILEGKITLFTEKEIKGE